MTDNPFAPPEADVQDPLPSTGSVDVARCFNEGWANTWSNFPLWLGVGFVWLIATIGAAITCVGILLLVPILYWGWIRFTLKMHDGGAQMDDVWSGFQNYGRVLAAMIILYLINMLLGIPGQVVYFMAGLSESVPIIIAGFVLSMAWSFYISLRIYLAPFLIVDRDMEPIEAFKRAWDLSKQHHMSLIKLMLLTILVVVLGMLLLGVGVIPASILASLMWVSAYRQIVGPRPQQQTTEERIEADWNEA